jgi:hypothetical protein
MATAIIDGTNIDTSVFSYSSPKANPTGGKVVNLYNKYFKESLTLSTPLMLTWGAQEGMDQAKNPTGKFTMSLQFPNSDYSNPDADAFLASMRTLERKVRTDALANSKEWFGKTITSEDVMEEKFNIMLRHPKIKGTQVIDETKAPTLTVKIPCWKGIWQSEIYDEEGNPLFLKGKNHTHLTPLDFLKPKTHVICLIQCGGLWFVNGKVSITWNLKQAIVQKPKTPSIVEGTCFLRPKASEVQKLKALPPPEDDIDPDGGAINSVIVEDSDDEEFELPRPTPTPTPILETSNIPTETITTTTETTTTEEPKKKRVVSKKKADA